MPRLELRPLQPAEQALVDRVREYLKDATPGQPVKVPAELLQAMDDAARAAAMPEILARRRLEWLHSEGSNNVNGYEWGIYRVRWENGQPAEVWQTNADFSDLDAAMQDASAVPLHLSGEALERTKERIGRMRAAGIEPAPLDAWPNWHPCRDYDGATCADQDECATRCIRHGTAGAPDTLAKQLGRQQDALEAGHDPLCLKVIRGPDKACTCGVAVPGDQTKRGAGTDGSGSPG